MAELVKLAEIGQRIWEYMKYFVPGILVILALLTTYKMIKWGRTLSKAILEITRSPYFVMFFVLLAFILLFIWFNWSSEVGI